MTMRCDTTRNVAGSQRNRFNQPETTPTPILAGHPCYWQAQTERFIADGSKLVAFTSHLLLAPVGSDIDEEDFVTEVRNRRGKVLVSNRLRVLAAIPREDHLEVRLEEYS